ncbi:MAG TPA: type II toxin-antitoxin system VapC family toxin [Polyangia bacterium]
MTRRGPKRRRASGLPSEAPKPCPARSPPSESGNEGADTVLVSAVSAWEMTIKMSLGKLRFDGGIADAVEACGFERLDMRFEHAEAVRSLPSHHSDPFDRLLIAQVIGEGATFVTHDRAIANYLIPTLWI